MTEQVRKAVDAVLEAERALFAAHAALDKVVHDARAFDHTFVYNLSWIQTKIGEVSRWLKNDTTLFVRRHEGEQAIAEDNRGDAS